jgi:hypothetical protein
MAEFTFLKLQFDDASFAANAPFSASDDAEVETGEDADDEDSRGVLPILLGLVFLVVVAVVVKKFLGGDAEPPAVDVGTDDS